MIETLVLSGGGVRGLAYIGMVETIRQLTDQTIGNTVENAQHGLVSCFGMINYDRGICTSAAIFSRSTA